MLILTPKVTLTLTLTVTLTVTLMPTMANHFNTFTRSLHIELV